MQISSLAFQRILESPCRRLAAGLLVSKLSPLPRSPLGGGVRAAAALALTDHPLAPVFCIPESVEIASANICHILFLL